MSKINGLISAVNDWFTGEAQTVKFKTPNIGLPSNNIWLNKLIENGEPQNAPTDKSQEFWVAKSTDAQTLRNRLLKEHFGFEGDDIALYEKRIGQEFKIHDTGKCSAATAQKASCDWATADDIKDWRVNNGKVPISLTPETVNDLRQFKRERILDKVLAGVSDPALAQAVKNDLLQISNPNS